MGAQSLSHWTIREVFLLTLIFKKHFIIYLFTFGCAESWWLHGLSFSCGKRELLSSCSELASHRGGFSCSRAQAVGHMGFSRWGPWALELGLNSCGSWGSLLHGMWALPGSGIEPVPPALPGGFFTAEPPGKSQRNHFPPTPLTLDLAT